MIESSTNSRRPCSAVYLTFGFSPRIAENRIRGSLLFELHAVTAEEARRSSQDAGFVMEALLVSRVLHRGSPLHTESSDELNTFITCALAEIEILPRTGGEHVEIRTEWIARRTDGRAMQEKRRRFGLVVETNSRVDWQCAHVTIARFARRIRFIYFSICYYVIQSSKSSITLVHCFS